MSQSAEGVCFPRGSLRLFFLGLAMLPLFLSQFYGTLPVDAFVSDRMLKDFFFKMMGLASIGFLVPVKELRWIWWTILVCHLITKDALFQGDASFYLLNIGLGLILFSLVFKAQILFKWVCQGALISVIANLILQSFQVIGFDPFHSFWKLSATGIQLHQTSPVACGFLGNPVTLGIYYAICLPLLLVSAGKFFPLIAVPLLFGIALTHSKIALFAAVIVFMLSSKAWVKDYGPRWKWVLEAGFYLFITVIPFSLMFASSIESAVRNRWIIWSGALKHLVSPIWGDGLSSWNLRHFWHAGSLWPQACNEYLQIFYELGAIGLLLTGWYSVRLINRVRKLSLSVSSESAALAVFATAITSLFFFPIHLPQTAVPFVISLAYLERSIHVG